MRRMLLRYLRTTVPSFESLLTGPLSSPPRPDQGTAPGQEGATQLQLARAALRAMRRCPEIRRVWRPAPLYGLLRAACADVRWTGVECVVLLAGLVCLHAMCLWARVFLVQVVMRFWPDWCACTPSCIPGNN